MTNNRPKTYKTSDKQYQKAYTRYQKIASKKIAWVVKHGGTPRSATPVSFQEFRFLYQALKESPQGYHDVVLETAKRTTYDWSPKQAKAAIQKLLDLGVSKQDLPNFADLRVDGEDALRAWQNSSKNVSKIQLVLNDVYEAMANS